jgi:DNA-binding NtrC family response regulator
MNTGMQVQPSPKSGKQHQMSILIVDDEPDILRIFKKSFDLEGYTSYGFVNPIAALKHFQENPNAYDIVITDVRMPGMSGLEFAKELRKVNQDVKIILMSSFEITMPELNKVLPSIDVDAIFDKPIRLDKLREVIKSVTK